MKRSRPFSIILFITSCLLTSVFGNQKSDSSITPQKNFSVDLGSSITLEMIWISGGTFQMGSPSSESGRYDSEGPMHSVELDGFWMGKYEVTQEQYQAVMGINPSNFKRAANPVENVSWNDAMGFCRKLQTKTGHLFTLPTEAQWEYACRAGTQTRFHFGDSKLTLADYAWIRRSFTRRRTHPAGEKKPNQFGLYDMNGNVVEWCADWYGDYTSGSAKNPPGPSSGAYRVCRGGSVYSRPENCRSSARSHLIPENRGNTLGFRVARSPFR
ncbi:MAG TPA: formylglycine-generating enzyme family protein [Candidatus Sumerlaeota bacterium]|nr:formylglycine-generating enzyme family protein [Candidatus Sumerlaeota bacterium]